VVHAARHRAVDALAGELRSEGIAAVTAGDARAPRQVADAIRDGYDCVGAAAHAEVYI
jgi:hypothetical protein